MMVEVYRSEAGFLSLVSFLSALAFLKESFTRPMVLAKEVAERVLAASSAASLAEVVVVFWALGMLAVVGGCWGCKCGGMVAWGGECEE